MCISNFLSISMSQVYLLFERINLDITKSVSDNRYYGVIHINYTGEMSDCVSILTLCVNLMTVCNNNVVQVMPSQKLPALYLIDSVIKNISDSSYLQLFTKNIVNNFVLVFEQVVCMFMCYLVPYYVLINIDTACI